jgi:O-antigen/teichoic acid export membrane protein
VSLRRRVLHGGIYLVLRQGLGIILSTVGMILLARAIGPDAYGVYAAAFGIYIYVANVCRWGVDVYLVRRESEPPLQDYHQAFSLLLLVSFAGTGLAILALPLLERWMQLDRFGPVAAALFAALPLMVLSTVPLARLERALDFRNIALVELSGQVALYIVALPSAYLGLGPWAPVVGMWASQLLTLVLLYRTSGYRPRLHWEFARVRAMMGYGLGISASDWLWNLGNLVNPLIVGRYVGAEAVAQVALAARLVEQAGSIIMIPSTRISTPVFARLQADTAQLRKALAEAMSLQLMMQGPVLAVIGLVAPWIVPLLLGPSWLPAVTVYPFIALSYLVGTAFSLHSALLWVLRRIWEVALFRLVHLVLLVVSALLLVPPLGLIGFGYAELLALPAWILLLVFFRMHVGKPVSAQAAVWFTAWAIPVIGWPLGLWVWMSAILPLTLSITRWQL